MAFRYKPLRIMLEVSGFKLMFKLLKLARNRLQSAIAGCLQTLPVPSDTLGPPKGLVPIENYARRGGLSLCEVFHAEERSEPIQNFLPTKYAFKQSLSTDFSMTTILAAHVATLPRGRVLGCDGLVITADDQVVTETLGSFRGSSAPHPIFSSIRLPRIQRYPGRLAVVGYNYAHGYYHWMLEILPRFEILRRSRVQFDAVYMSPLVARFQQEALDAIGFDHRLAIWSDAKTHLQPDHLIVPSLPGAPGQIPRWVVDYLRNLLLPKTVPIQDQFLLISRRKAARRRIVNEEQVSKVLKPLGFLEVVLEDHSLHEQARLFASAKYIVATHGAALTNLVFCSPGTTVVELFAPTRTYNNFQVLSHLMGLHYRGLMTTAEGLGRTATRKQDLLVDAAALADLIR